LQYAFPLLSQSARVSQPAFGSIFSNYLKHYTHWGYCDLDMLIGNLPMFIERSELSDFDIVTYTFGDQEAVYLRGQWTLHRNAIAVSTVWKGCPHLGSQLQKELLLKVAWVRRMESRGIQNYPKRFQSAEGCYSQKAVAAQSLKIKTSNKQVIFSLCCQAIPSCASYIMRSAHSNSLAMVPWTVCWTNCTV